MFEDADSAVFNIGNTLINLLRATAAIELIAPVAVGGHDAGPRMQFTVDVDDGYLVERSGGPEGPTRMVRVEAFDRVALAPSSMARASTDSAWLRLPSRSMHSTEWYGSSG